jgi:gliding motility-associated-like protein
MQTMVGAGQTKERPNTPSIISVSVNPFVRGEVTIKWQKSPSLYIDEYTIFYFKTLGYEPIKPIPYDTSQCTFIQDENYLRSITYSIAAISNSPIYQHSDSPLSDSHRTIFASVLYDTCKTQIKITWTPYVGWGDKLSKYRVYRMEDNVKRTEMSGASGFPTSTLSFTDSAILDKHKYSYYIKAENTNGDTVTSNMTEVKFITSGLPDYVFAEHASLISGNLVELKFLIDSKSSLKTYQLSSSDSYNGTFVATQTRIFLGDSSSLTFRDTLPDLAPKYYHLTVLNKCKIGDRASNLATAMIANASAGANSIKISWTAYREWPAGVQEYRIYRSIGSDPFLQLDPTTGLTDYTDNIASLVGQQFSGNLCYRIEAVSKPDTAFRTFYSLSSTVCIDLSQSIFIPSAFTPNGDGQNDEFKPSFAFLPAKYNLSIYNRYGSMVFQSSDPLKGWNGIASGNRAVEGEYIYLIRFVSATGKAIERKGNFSLIYP